MPSSFLVRPLPYLLPALLLLAGACAPFGHRSDPAPTGNTVIVGEPAASAGGPAVPDQPPEEPHSDLLLGAARLVANDGRMGHQAIGLGDRWYGRGCGPLDGSILPEPLAEAGVRRSFNSLEDARTWLFIGVAFSGDGMVPAVVGGPCGNRWLRDAVGARTARLPGDVSGRDTSLTFTTSRAAAFSGSAAAAGAVGAVIDHFVGRPDRGGDGPRTAQPRSAGDAKPAPAATPKAEPVKAEPEKSAPGSARPASRPGGS